MIGRLELPPDLVADPLAAQAALSDTIDRYFDWKLKGELILDGIHVYASANAMRLDDSMGRVEIAKAIDLWIGLGKNVFRALSAPNEVARHIAPRELIDQTAQRLSVEIKPSLVELIQVARHAPPDWDSYLEQTNPNFEALTDANLLANPDTRPLPPPPPPPMFSTRSRDPFR